MTKLSQTLYGLAASRLEEALQHDTIVPKNLEWPVKTGPSNHLGVDTPYPAHSKRDTFMVILVFRILHIQCTAVITLACRIHNGKSLQHDSMASWTMAQ